MRAWLWLVLALAIVGSVVLVTRRSRATPSIDPALLVTMQRRDLEVEVLELGHVAPREKVEVKSRLAGQVASVLVQEGERITKGQVVVVLDPIDYERELASAEASVAQASAALDFAKLTQGRAARGFAQEIVSRSELDLAAHELKAKGVALQGAAIVRAVARDRLGYTKIVAPMAGTVIARGIEPGEAVVPGVQSTFDGKALLTIADLSGLLVRVNLNQIDVAKVTESRAVTLTLDALPGSTYRAHITKIAPASVKLPGKDQEVFPVEAALDEPDGRVKPGMTVDVRIHLDAKKSVLVIPLEALVKEGGKTFVVGPALERTEVVPGLRNDREVEIVRGGRDGMQVLLRPGSAADNETKP